jgi:hypothetical protein
MLLYLSNDGDLNLSQDVNDVVDFQELQKLGKNLRCIGYIDRVAISTNTGSNGELAITYEITGRDIGVVYSETEIWINQLAFEVGSKSRISKALTRDYSTSLRTLLRILHGGFLFPDSVHDLMPELKGKASLLEGVGGTGQWLLPSALLDCLNVSLLNSSKGSYFGNIAEIITEEYFKEVPITRALENPLALVEGAVWDKLKQFSIPALNELFLELDEKGSPHLNFRPIPWKLSSKGYPQYAHNVDSLSDLLPHGIFIASAELISANIGFDNHSRYTHFYAKTTKLNSNDKTQTSLLSNPSAFTGRRFPYSDEANMLRHGFRPMHVDLATSLQDTASALTNGKNASTEDGANRLIEYNELMLDYWAGAVKLATGEVMISGSNAVKLGKVLTLPEEIPLFQNKLFYVEGYTDKFIVNDNGSAQWEQSIQVTRGTDLTEVQRQLLKDLKRGLGSPFGLAKSFAGTLT